MSHPPGSGRRNKPITWQWEEGISHPPSSGRKEKTTTWQWGTNKSPGSSRVKLTNCKRRNKPPGGGKNKPPAQWGGLSHLARGASKKPSGKHGEVINHLAEVTER
jgi:hypothetical protein